MIIREATDSDLDGIRVLYQHLHPSDPMLSSGDLRDSWLALLANPSVHCPIAEIDYQLLSTCTLVVVPNLTRSARPYGFVENVVTHAQHRKKGLGTAVLKAALGLAWKCGCYKVMLMTGSRRQETLSFYERAGFLSGEKTGLLARPG